MKITVPFLTAMLFFSLFVNISSTANPHLQLNASEEPNGEHTGCFVQFADGTVKQFTTLKLVTKMFKTPHLLANDSVIIYGPELKAYQNEEGYAVSQSVFGKFKKTYVAKSVLPGFAVRVVKGYLNIFSIKYYNGQNVTEKLFIQQPDAAAITPYTPEMLETLLKENSDALALLSTENKTLTGTKKILAAVELFNSSKLLTKN
jgi:hypothetical protein